jgi:hypothetical protein
LYSWPGNKVCDGNFFFETGGASPKNKLKTAQRVPEAKYKLREGKQRGRK